MTNILAYIAVNKKSGLTAVGAELQKLWPAVKDKFCRESPGIAANGGAESNTIRVMTLPIRALFILVMIDPITYKESGVRWKGGLSNIERDIVLGIYFRTYYMQKCDLHTSGIRILGLS
ncbi:hypothetical protein CANCADRAFT_44611 [Tortispora caseinolytica NRRL Y-17796]|uniref:Uncharacterized protein n=1 Tax=Tortispora caseinolytica NRRL Y-17796 TaxID=767744 RepID=A0A1E4TH29_9ASCO|nr:hypothetical protein CANCADRAFT_44611 [Tortispora caseinolytica NRRL Y-17796]